jgi:rhodanese-related sulfurtransferase
VQVGAWARIDAREAHARREAGWKPFVLDVRGPAEAAIVSIPGTDALVPHTEVAARLQEVPRDREVLVYCKLGGRSSQAAQVLAEAGYRVTNLEGGVVGWARDVDPALPTY